MFIYSFKKNYSLLNTTEKLKKKIIPEQLNNDMRLI